MRGGGGGGMNPVCCTYCRLALFVVGGLIKANKEQSYLTEGSDGVPVYQLQTAMACQDYHNLYCLKEWSTLKGS